MPLARCIAGHFTYARFMQACRLTDLPPRFFSFVHDPMDRLMSDYAYYTLRLRSGELPDEKNLGALSAEAYFTIGLEKEQQRGSS